MPDLDVQVRRYIEAASPPLTVDDVLEARVGEDRGRPLAQRTMARDARQGWVVAAAAAIIVLIVIGAAGWLVGSGSSGEPSDQATAPTPGASTTTVPTTLASTTTVPTTLASTTTVPTTLASTTDVRNLTWVPVPLDVEEFGSSAQLLTVAASESLVVVGGSVSGKAAIWTSSDRVTWSRVAHDDEVFGGPGRQEIIEIVQWGSGFVAAGRAGIDNGIRERIAVWHSEDGLDWTRVPHDEALFGRAGDLESRHFSMAATDTGLMMVTTDSSVDPAVDIFWTSTDGVSWNRQLRPSVDLSAVAGYAGEFVAVGNKGIISVRVLSGDGVLRRVLTGGNGLGEGRGLDVAATDFGLLVVGISELGSEHPAVWVSRDGSDWTRTGFGSVLVDGAVLASVAMADSGVVVVGREDNEGGPSAIIVSSDGTDWEVAVPPEILTMSRLESVASFRGHFVVVGVGDNQPELWTTDE